MKEESRCATLKDWNMRTILGHKYLSFDQKVLYWSYLCSVATFFLLKSPQSGRIEKHQSKGLSSLAWEEERKKTARVERVQIEFEEGWLVLDRDWPPDWRMALVDIEGRSIRLKPVRPTVHQREAINCLETNFHFKLGRSYATQVFFPCSAWAAC